MKYNKKKKLQQGGTLDIKKVMEEARRNQQEYQAALIAEDAQRTAAKEKIQGEVIQAPSTHINTPAVNIGQVNPNMAHIPKPAQRVQRTKPVNQPTNKPISKPKEQIVQRPVQSQVVLPTITEVPDSTRVVINNPPVQSRNTNPYGTYQQRDLGTISQARPSGPKFDWGDIRRWFNGMNQGRLFYQQGGKVEGGNQELIADFAIRYLRGQGIAEEDIVGQDGNINPQYVDELTEVIQEVNTPEFWDSYKQDPDGTLAAYMESTQTPEQVEMAKKGAKLKQLKNKKNRMCKCGCKLSLKKEGGKVVEKCSCGCK